MANSPYTNFVLENKIEDMLTTKLDLAAYLTTDYSLTENAGMEKHINVYTATGNVEDLTQGVGNTSTIEASYTPASYTVGVTQGRGVYFDEEAMKDPMVVETIIKGMAEKMTNDFTAKAIAELEKASLYKVCDFSTTTSGYLFGCIVDALANFGESEEDVFCLINPKAKAYFRKALGDDLKYSEGFVRTGYIGTVCGVPVIVSKAVGDDEALIATREAVTAFIKKGVETEQERDANTRKNSLYIRKVSVVALTDATKAVKLVKTAPSPSTSA